MEFFDSLINEVAFLCESFTKKDYPYNGASLWTDIGYNEVILQRDTAYELDGVGFNLVTSSEIEEGITVIGDDLCNIKESRNFSRVCLVQLQDNGDEQENYKAIKKVDYVKYHHFPEGYMIRTTSRSHKESVRVAKSALKSGISFQKVGNLLIKKYKENPGVKAVRVIYITDYKADYKRLEEMARQNNSIAETLNHVMNTVKFDCDTCSLKPVCDEVEGMKELHFKNAAMR